MSDEEVIGRIDHIMAFFLQMSGACWVALGGVGWLAYGGQHATRDGGE